MSGVRGIVGADLCARGSALLPPLPSGEGWGEGEFERHPHAEVLMWHSRPGCDRPKVDINESQLGKHQCRRMPTLFPAPGIPGEGREGVSSDDLNLLLA